MTRLRFTFKDDEEEKKEKFGWAERTRGIGELPDLIKKEEEPLPEIKPTGKLEFTDAFKAQVGIGAKAVDETELPTGATLTMLPPKHRIQSLSLKEDYERETLETPGISQRMRGIGEPPKEYEFTGPTIDYMKANRSAWAIWFEEFQVTPDKWKFLKGEDWSSELESISEEAKLSARKASELGVNINDWIQTGVYAAFFTTLAAGIYPVVKDLPANILNNLTYKVEDKTVKGKELLKVLQRITYPGPRSGYGTPSKFDRKVFDEFVRRGGLRGIGKNLKAGVTVSEVTPRFAFGAKLYAGLPADEIVKSIVEVGKVSVDVVKGLDPAKVSQVTQQLMNVSPALASEFLKAVKKVEVPKEAPKPQKALEVEKSLGFEVKPTTHKEKEEALKLAIEEVKKIVDWSGELKTMGTFVTKTDKPYSDIDVMITTDNYLKYDVALNFERIQKDVLSKTGVFIDFSPQGIPTGKTKEILKVELKPPREQLYAEKYDIPLEKVKVTELPKEELKETVGEAEIRMLEEAVGKRFTAEEVLKKVREPERKEPRPKAEPKAPQIGEKYTGKAYRAETYIPEHGAEIVGKMKTAQEKLDYDYGTTGNPVFKEAEKVAGNLGIELGKVPVKELVWVAPKLEIAEKYGEAEEYKLTEDTVILAKDDEGGLLVLKNADDYAEPVTVGLTKEGKVEPLWAGGEVGAEEVYKEGGKKLPTAKVKGKLRELTGQIPKKIEIAERDILRLVLRGEAKGARKAFSEGKKAGIFTAKEKFADVVERAKERKFKRDEIGKVKDILKKTDLKHLRPERQKAIKKIIDDIDLAKITEKTKRKLTSRLNYIKDNPDNLIPQNKLDELARLNFKPISDFTAEDVSLIKTAILHEIKLNKLKNKLIFGKEIKEASEVLKTARENVLKGKDIKKDDASIIDSGISEHRTSWQRIKNWWKVGSFNPEVICEELDFKDHGEVMKYIFNGIDNGVSDKFRTMQEIDDRFFLDKLKGIDVSKWSKSFQANKKNIDFQTIKLSANKDLKIPERTIKITKGERISFLSHDKNEKNLKHLLSKDGGFRFSDNLTQKHKITEENLEEIIDSTTKEEVKVANVLWSFFNEQTKSKLNEASMELNGWEVATEDNYYPIRTVELDRRRDALKARKNFSEATLEGLGIFKERTNASNALIIEDAFTVAYKHLEQTSSYIGLAKPLRYAKLILEDTEFNENVRKVYGKEYIENLKKYLQNIEGEVINLDNVDNLAVGLVNKLDSAILGMHIFVMFKQPISYLIANTEIEAKYLQKAILMRNNFKEIRENSPQLRSRLDGNITRELGELGNVGKVRNFFLHKSPLNSKVLAGIRKFDSFTIGKIWNACKLEVKDRCPLLSEEEYIERVTDKAEEVIRRTQPTWHPKDRSEIARSKSIFVRLLTKYTSQRNKNRIVLKRSTLKYNRSKHTAKDKVSLLKKYAIVLVANALLIEAINELRRKAYGTKSRSTWQYAVAAIGTALSNFYFVGDLFNSLASKIQKGTYAGYDTGNIVSSYMDNAIDGLAELGRTIEQLQSQERYKSGSRKGNLKYRTTALRALDKNASTLLSLKGLPYENVKRLLQGMWRMAGDKEEKPSKTPLKITVPKGGKLKFAEPKLKIKSTKLKFNF